jgi:hypothetical protein
MSGTTFLRNKANAGYGGGLYDDGCTGQLDLAWLAAHNQRLVCFIRSAQRQPRTASCIEALLVRLWMSSSPNVLAR